MKIGLNLLSLHPGSVGVKVNSINLVRCLLKNINSLNHFKKIDLYIFTSETGLSLLNDEIPKLCDAEGRVSASIKLISFNPKNKIYRLFLEQFYLPYIARRYALDMIHSFDYVIPYFSSVKKIASIHDLNYKNYPEVFNYKQKLIRKLLVPLSIATSDMIITLSAASKEEIKARFNVDEKIIHVVHCGFDNLGSSINQTNNAVRLRKIIGESDYILAVGTLNPHKNYPNLIEAFSKIKCTNTKLVIAGKDGGLMRRLQNMSIELQIEDRICLLGFVTEYELKYLYENAILFVMPSLYEGFGIPLLEAMSNKVPVACSKLDVFIEIASDAVSYFDASDITNMVKVISELLEDDKLRKSYVIKGLERASLFSWDKSAQKVIEIYDKLINN